MKPRRHKLLSFWTAVAIIATAVASFAQTRDINVAATEQTWDGPAAGVRAGAWLDQGALRARTLVTDQRRDLIVGAPGGPGIVGAVYIIYGGPVRTGAQNLSTADAIITGEAAGDLFGTSTAAGAILKQEGLNPVNLVVGAPGVSGGRGAVYLFAGAFVPHDSLTTANAVLKILGAPGDQLGTMLATGDLDSDGYREIIIGAAGNQRVYIIKGGPSLSGLIDLSVTAATRTIPALGVGGVLAAGDVTGDGVYDLLIGAPTQNVVYLFTGAAGAIPSAAAAAFTGIDVNDRAGAAIRLADMDQDGHRDILIGGPGGDGPGNARTDAGEVYLIWGGAPLTNRNLSLADAVFYGRAGERLGAAIAAGDINRDSPNDAVMLAESAASGTGILYLYYGRTRATFGTAQPSGQRVVDFTDDNQVSRRIGSDPTLGAIVSAQVFEVTGEGARDVIVGIPTVNGNTGRVFFTLSPKLVLSNNLYNLTLRQGASAIAALQVQDPATIPITWTITSNAAWLTVSPPEGGSVANSPTNVAIIVNTASLAPGVYTGTLTVTSTSPDLVMSLPVTVNLTVTAPSGPIAAPAGDFDGDGRGNRSVFSPGTGLWSIEPSTSVQFGQSGDVAVAGDYDGNGSVDVAVYRPGTGEWLIRNQTTVQLGQTNDIPVPADYDGNRTTDPAVYRASGGALAYWHVKGQAAQQFGLGGDIPVPADYDGDGKADLAVFRPSNGTWYVLNSSNASITVTQFGVVGDVPVPGDFDGDGKADAVVFRPASGTWYMLQTLGGYSPVQFGLPGDIPLALDGDGDRVPELTVWRPSTATWYSFNRVAGVMTSGVWGAVGARPVLARPVLPTNVTRDADGDGRADLIVYRPSEGNWYIRYSSTGFGTYTSTPWGLPGDMPVPGDYDGDRRIDVAVYRPSNNVWYIIHSSTGAAQALQWGGAGDIPLVMDYDGDGRTDVVVYRPSTGEWWIRLSSTGYVTWALRQWGLNGDQPVPADYDGDGKADLAIYRPSTGDWWLSLSTGGSPVVINLGVSGDQPMPADYDGDGRANVAVYRPSEGNWYAVGLTTVQWGLPGDMPAPQDFDGDGKADHVVFRASSGFWFVRLSSGGALQMQWGLNGDTPLLHAGGGGE